MSRWCECYVFTDNLAALSASRWCRRESPSARQLGCARSARCPLRRQGELGSAWSTSFVSDTGCSTDPPQFAIYDSRRAWFPDAHSYLYWTVCGVIVDGSVELQVVQLWSVAVLHSNSAIRLLLRRDLGVKRLLIVCTIKRKNVPISPKIAPNCTLMACCALFLIVSSHEPEAPLEPPDCDSRKDVPVDEHSLMRRKAFFDNE